MTPSVPSLPTKSWVRFGPVAARGPVPSVCTTRPSASTTSRPEDHVLDLPVAGRVLPGAPAGQPAADGGEVHGLGPVAKGVAVSHLAERGLEVGAEGAGPHVGGERGLVDVDRRPPAPSCRGRCHRAPGSTRRRHRCGPRRRSPARAASLQAASTPATCSVDVGRTTAAGRWGTPPSAAQPMASGHQSRPASALASSSVRTVGPARRRCGRAARVGPRRSAAPRRSSTPPAACVDRRDGSRLRHGRSSPAVRSSFWQDPVNRATCSAASCSLPAHVRRDEVGDGWRPRPSWRAHAGSSPGSAVTGRRRGSAPSPRGPRRRAPHRCRAAPPRPVRAIRDGRRPRQGRRRTRCRSDRAGAPWGWAIVTGSRVLVVAPMRGRDLVTQRRRRGDSPRRPTTASTVSCAILR